MANNVLGVGYTLGYDDDYGMRTLGARLDEAEKLGMDFVEIPLWSMDLICGAKVLPDRLKTVKSMLSGRRLRYTVHGSLAINFMDVPERLERHKEVLRASLDVSAELEGLHYVLHGGIHPVASPAETDGLYAQQRDLISGFGEQAAELGLIIVVENLFVEPARATALPSRLARELAAIAHPNVWACLDFSHGFIYSTAMGANFAEEVAALAPFARHLHVHDSFGRPAVMPTYTRAERFAYGEGDLHLPPGLGAIPWDDLMRRLEFPGGVVFNLELAPPYWADLERAVAATRRLAGQAQTAGS
jgi:sugar phosphate isomerase/epimerase